MNLIELLEASHRSIDHLKLNGNAPKNDFQRESGFSGIFKDTLGRFFMAREQITSGRFDTPLEAVYDWHARSIEKRAGGKFINELYAVDAELPPEVILADIAYMIDFNFKSGFRGVQRHTDGVGTYFVCRRKINNKFVTSSQREHPAKAAWDVHTMRNVHVEDAYEIPEELRKEAFGPVKPLDIAYMIDPTNQSGYSRVMYDSMLKAFVGVYQTNGVVNRTRSYGTPEQAAWAVHNLVVFANKHVASHANRRTVGRRTVRDIVVPARSAYADAKEALKNG